MENKKDKDQAAKVIEFLNGQIKQFDEQIAKVEAEVEKIQTDKQRKADEAEAKRRAAEQAQALKDAEATKKKSKKALADYKKQLEYYESRQVRAEGAEKGKMDDKVTELKLLIEEAQYAADTAEGLLSQAAEASRKAKAAKEESEAIDKIVTEATTLEATRDKLIVKIDELIKNATKYTDAPEKLAENTTQQAKLNAELTKLQEAIDKKWAALKMLTDAKAAREAAEHNAEMER